MQKQSVDVASLLKPNLGDLSIELTKRVPKNPLFLSRIIWEDAQSTFAISGEA
jgi:hypothetical protein